MELDIAGQDAGGRARLVDGEDEIAPPCTLENERRARADDDPIPLAPQRSAISNPTELGEGIDIDATSTQDLIKGKIEGSHAEKVWRESGRGDMHPLAIADVESADAGDNQSNGDAGVWIRPRQVARLR